MVIGLKKKGDVTITTMILIVLGLAVLVMLIVGFTKGWDFFFGKFDQAPSELQTIAKACALYAQGGLSIDFCGYKWAGKELVNCRDPRIIAELTGDGVDFSHDSLKCGADDAAKIKSKTEACKSLAPGKPETKINNVEKCASFVGAKSCTGTPTGCEGKLLAVCVTPGSGCKWDSTGLVASCKGDENYCKTLTESTCGNMAGCSLSA